MKKNIWRQEALLHDHLDGSFPLLEILPELFRLSGKEYPFGGKENSHKEIKRVFLDAMTDITAKFSHTTGVMQSEETLRLAAETYTCVRARQGFKYCEATIAPQYHIFGGLREEEAVSALIEGIKRGEKKYPRIEVNLLFAVGREAPAEKGVRLVEAASRCDRNYVVGISLVCDETANPPEKHLPMFARAKELGFKTTVHAGEWIKKRPPEKTASRAAIRKNAVADQAGLIRNISTAVFRLKADRIGHATALAFDSALMEAVIDKKIGVEGCPGSNFALKYIPDMAYLQIREMLCAGALYSINPDDDLFLPDLQKTFDMCDAEYNFTEKERRLLRANAWKVKFGSRKYDAGGRSR